MAAANRKLKQIVLDIGGTEFQAQVRSWTLNDETDDPETFYVFEPGEEFVEQPDPAYTLECEFYSDWRSDGISDYLWSHRGETVTFELTHHPDIPAESRRFSGQLQIKAPSVGGEVRTTETSSVTFPIVGDITYAAA